MTGTAFTSHQAANKNEDITDDMSNENNTADQTVAKTLTATNDVRESTTSFIAMPALPSIVAVDPSLNIRNSADNHNPLLRRLSGQNQTQAATASRTASVCFVSDNVEPNNGMEPANKCGVNETTTDSSATPATTTTPTTTPPTTTTTTTTANSATPSPAPVLRRISNKGSRSGQSRPTSVCFAEDIGNTNCTTVKYSTDPTQPEISIAAAAFRTRKVSGGCGSVIGSGPASEERIYVTAGAPSSNMNNSRAAGYDYPVTVTDDIDSGVSVQTIDYGVKVTGTWRDEVMLSDLGIEGTTVVAGDRESTKKSIRPRSRSLSGPSQIIVMLKRSLSLKNKGSGRVVEKTEVCV
ncbi:hypothetical protein HDU76_008854 [Blyttiomyces sp. JEL0837]|nr:hypothetical protein HDU76_008854 [Blyttiomyces sp. JEL0837]